MKRINDGIVFQHGDRAVVKPYANIRLYQVHENGKILATFDDYNHQAPLRQAKAMAKDRA